MGYELKGRVNACTAERLLGFYIEVELDSESRWSDQWFQPQHLLSLLPGLRYFTEPMPQITEKIFPAGALPNYRPTAVVAAIR